MSNQDDYAALEAAQAEVNAVAKPDQVNQLEADIRNAMRLSETVASLEAALRAHKDTLNALLQRAIPEGMSALGILKKEVDGATITCKPFASGSLPKEEEPRAKALDWLQANGAAPLVKAFFDFQVPKGDLKKLNNVIGNVRAILAENGLDLAEEVSIHPQTLYAFCRERLRKGEPIPLETLGVHIGKVARITLPTGGSAEIDE